MSIQATKTRLESQLAAALESGQPTTEIRAALALADNEIARLDRLEGGAALDALAEAAALRDRQLLQIEAEISALATLTLPPPPPVAPPVAVILAAREAANAALRAQTHGERLAALGGRLRALLEERAALAERRADGAHKEHDAAALGLLDLDIEGVRGLLAQAHADAPTPAATARRREEDASDAWLRDVAQVRRERLRSLAAALEGRLLEVADALGAPPITGRYAPGPRLRALALRGFQ